MNHWKKKFQIFCQMQFFPQKREELFEELYNHYFSRLLTYYQMLNPSDNAENEDLTQNTMVKIYQNLHTFNPFYSLNTWVYRIARNTLIDFKRKKKKDFRLEIYSESSEEEFFKKCENENLDNAVSSLKETDQNLLYLYFHEKMTYGEIAEVYHLKKHHIRYRIEKSLERLKLLLGEEE